MNEDEEVMSEPEFFIRFQDENGVKSVVKSKWKYNPLPPIITDEKWIDNIVKKLHSETIETRE